MKFSSGKRIGQSEQQLTTAVLFSFFLHVILFLTALFLHFTVMPRITVPPFYAVKLVGLPSDLLPRSNAVPESAAPPAAAEAAGKTRACKIQGEKRSGQDANGRRKAVCPSLPIQIRKRSRQTSIRKSRQSPRPQQRGLRETAGSSGRRRR